MGVYFLENSYNGGRDELHKKMIVKLKSTKKCKANP